jgi:acyl carrier protein
MGRIDNQVKVRGFRIETGEIENRLTVHGDIGEAVVILNRDGQLCAYFVARGPLSAPELREYLSISLPAYMIPSYFIQLDKIPLTPNGKVDRKSLPAPGLVRPDLAQAYVAPVTDLEKTIADTWKEVLHLAEIGIDDNFFDIGGNSLALIQVNKKLNRTLDTQVPVIDMFRYTTIRSLSQYLEQPGMNTGLDRKKRADALERGKNDRQQRFQKRKQITRKTL